MSLSACLGGPESRLHPWPAPHIPSCITQLSRAWEAQLDWCCPLSPVLTTTTSWWQSKPGTAPSAPVGKRSKEHYATVFPRGVAINNLEVSDLQPPAFLFCSLVFTVEGPGGGHLDLQPSSVLSYFSIWSGTSCFQFANMFCPYNVF